MFSSRLTHFIWYLIQDNRRNPVIARIALLFRNIHRAYEHPGHILELNGEGAFLDFLKKHRPPSVVFDVGANVGDWSAVAREFFPNAQLHLFEIAPPIFEKLQSRYRDQPQFVLNKLGLSSEEKEVTLNFYPDHSELTSVEISINSVQTERIQVWTKTGDQYLESVGNIQVDLVKIDTEGMELKVLQGFSKTLTERPPAFIQFEHFHGRAYLKDFYDLLVPHGYSIGKLYSTYVDFRSHDLSLENGIGPNYIAIHESAGEFIPLLKQSLSS